MIPHICSHVRVGTGHIQEVLLRSTSTLTSVPSVSFRQTVSKLQEHIQQNHPLAPAEPEEYRLLLEKGHGPGESSEAVSLCLQRVRGPDPVEVPKVTDTTQGPGCDSYQHGEHKEMPGFP